MELIYSASMRERFGLVFPATTLAPSSGDAIGALSEEWLVLMGKVFLVGTVLSFCVAKVLHEVVEKPMASAVVKYVFPRPSSENKKLE